MPEQPDATANPADAPTLSAPPAASENLPAAEIPPEQPTLNPDSESTPSLAANAPALVGGEKPARAFGDYELLGEIARGGMGVVYRARERQSGRLVALKMMLADSAVDATYVQRFALEAKATGELSHPGIVAIHAWGQHEGQFFYTMDYVPGFPLSRILRRRPLAVPRAVRYLLGIARAVAAAHAQGIVHRDLKPGNVVIDPSDQPRVLDFGLAKRHRAGPIPADRNAVEVNAVDDVVDVLPADAECAVPSAPADSKDTPPRTQKGAVLGTPSYMAPEQARGEHGKVGPAADVHALGAIFFEMLTGRPPYEAPTMMDTLIQVIEQKPPRMAALNRKVPAALQEVCLHCLEKDARDRYPNAGALADDLERRWRRAAQKRRFARLALASGLLFGMLLFIRFGLLNREWLTLDALSQMAANWAAIGGPTMQGAASILATLLGSVLSVAPFLCLLAFLVWLAAWLANSVEGSRGKRRRADAGPLDSEPYLQRLFAVRGEAPAHHAAQAMTAGIELADIEFARTLYESAACRVRKGRQRSLDRPVLVWLDPGRPPEGMAAPGVVVRHPSVLNLHAVGSGPEGRYLVTEPAAATPLAELLERRSLDPLEAAFLIVKVAYALQAFHDQGVRHGRLSADWILAQGDLEPLLCPCGVPSQAADDREQDITALGRLLRDWLPPRPPRWWRSPLAMLYQVADAAGANEYERPADFARDLERAAHAAHVRRWERVGGILFFILWALPLLAGFVGLAVDYAVGADAETSSGVRQVALFVAQHLLIILAPAAVLLGLVQSWGMVRGYRLRLRCSAFAPLMRSKLTSQLLLTLLVMLIPAVLACVALHRLGQPISFLVWLLAAAELLGFWLLGICLMGLVTFGEFLVESVRAQPTDILIGSAALVSAPEANRPSPQEAARTLGGRTRW